MAATMAPTIGAVTYSHASLKLPVATIGPSARAGLKGAPVRAPPIRMLKVSVIPIASGARLPARPATAVLWANAIATIPGRPTPSPTTAAAPAPMNTNEKVPMNSARSLGANRLDIVDSRDEMTIRRDQVSARERYAGWGVADGTGERRRPAKRTGLLRGYHLRFEINCQSLRDACAVGV